MISHLRLTTCILVLLVSYALPAHAEDKEAAPTTSEKRDPKPATLKCHLKFDLAGWSVFYKTAKGSGVIRCNNGQHADVTIRTHGGGITFGKHEIKNGSGTFSEVDTISELYGSYADAEAHAGVKDSAGAHAMTKGDISLAISGTGKGYDLGVAFGNFEIKPVAAEK